MADKKTDENTIKSITKEFSEAVFKMPRFSPAWFAFSFIPLLFIRNLGQKWYQIIIPALVIYGIGAALLGTLHRLIALSNIKPRDVIIEVDKERGLTECVYINMNNEITIPTYLRRGLYIAHFIWFGLLVWYLISREIILI